MLRILFQTDTDRLSHIRTEVSKMRDGYCDLSECALLGSSHRARNKPLSNWMHKWRSRPIVKQGLTTNTRRDTALIKVTCLQSLPRRLVWGCALIFMSPFSDVMPRNLWYRCCRIWRRGRSHRTAQAVLAPPKYSPQQEVREHNPPLRRSERPQMSRCSAPFACPSLNPHAPSRELIVAAAALVAAAAKQAAMMARTCPRARDGLPQHQWLTEARAREIVVYQRRHDIRSLLRPTFKHRQIEL